MVPRFAASQKVPLLLVPNRHEKQRRSIRLAS
jgi:hypothetical protein